MAEVESISHSGICVHDLKEAEEFYCNVLGARVHSRVNFKTQDALRGRSIHTTLTLDDYVFAVMLTEDWMEVPDAGQLRGDPIDRRKVAVGRLVARRLGLPGCGGPAHGRPRPRSDRGFAHPTVRLPRRRGGRMPARPSRLC